MNQKIAGYTKTEHFMLRQWERKIEDKLLNVVLNKLGKNKKQFLIVASRNMVRELSGPNLELFILIKGKVLITCFYGKLESQMSKKLNVKYELIQ